MRGSNFPDFIFFCLVSFILMCIVAKEENKKEIPLRPSIPIPVMTDIGPLKVEETTWKTMQKTKSDAIKTDYNSSLTYLMPISSITTDKIVTIHYDGTVECHKFPIEESASRAAHIFWRTFQHHLQKRLNNE
jgi:hypothetical protein